MRARRPAGPSPTYWIPHNKVTRVPRRHLFIDTEAHRHEDGPTESQTFRLAVAAFDRQERKGDDLKPTEWGEFSTPADLWAWVDARTRVGRSTVLWAHNLAYDLRVGQAFTILPAMGWSLEFVRFDRNQCAATWRRDGRTLKMADSMSWFGAKLETVGSMEGVGKYDMPRVDAPDETWFAYCRRDVEVLRAGMRRCLDWIEADDLGNWKPTGAGQGWAAFRHKHMTHRILHHGVEQVAELERTAAWAGRCEAWRHGDLGVGPWHELDFQSSYATVARDVDVPVRLVGRLTPSEARRYLAGKEGFAALVDVTVTTDTPTVPTRGPHGIVWPVGTFRSWLWDVEANEAQRDGATVTVHGGWLYRTAPALQQWARWVLDLLDAPADQLHPTLRLVVKGWSRSVIGRFGSQWSTWEPFGEAHGPDVSLATMIDGDAHTTTRLLTLGTDCMIEGPTEDAPDGAVHVMSYVMAIARLRLWAAMRIAGAEHVAYVDTDGLLVDPEGLERLRAANLPGLRSKAAYGHVEVLGPRQLVLDGKLRAAGIPSKAIRDSDGGWKGEVWRSLAVSLAQGDLDRVLVHDRTWKLAGTDHRRAHVAGGRTAALVAPFTD